MDRARRAGITALVGILALAAGLAETADSPGAPTERVAAELAAAVDWPVTTGLGIAEVVTGGASASDEWIELTNVGALPLDLVGLELVYVTSSGATVTRKASWSATLVLDPGRHLLLANAAGVHAAIADVTYSGGLAATGGALVLRPIGGAPVDAVGWGDAVNGFVEGTAAPAPPAGSSLERRPGGALGHATDSNDNASDFAVNPLPIAQDLDSPPTPGGGSPSPSPWPSQTSTPAPSSSPGPSVSPDPSASQDPSPDPSPTPGPSQSPDPEPSPEPSPWPDPSVEPSPAPSASPDPSADPSPSAEPSPPPSPEPSIAPSPSPDPSAVPSADPVVTAIGVVRGLADGTTATIEGVLTTALGIIDGSRGGFVQDATGGISLYLDAAPTVPIPARALIRATGTLAERYGQRTLRIAWSDVVELGQQELPAPLGRATGSAGETDEGRRVAVVGAVVESPTWLADGLGLSVDDGSGPVRVIVGPDALGGLSPARGDHLSVVGPLGQRDSSGTGLAGYRVFATLAGELAILVAPSPSPSPSLGSSPSPSAPTSSPSPSPSSSASPSPSPQPSAEPTLTIALARTMPLGTRVRVAGTVTSEPGRLGKPPLIAMEDATAGIVVHLPDGLEAPTPGARIAVGGKLAAPYGQLEIRPEIDTIEHLGSAAMPEPLRVEAGDLGEALEARLVELEGTVVAAPRRGTSGDLTVDVEGADGVATRVMVDATADIPREAFVTGALYSFVGIEGQRATSLGALDGYRVWLRDADDLRLLTSPSASPSPSFRPSPSSGSSPSPVPDGSSDPAVLSIAGALATVDVVVGIEAIVTAGPTLLDATGRRIVVQDPTGAVELLLPEPRSIRIGDRIRATGTVGTAYAAPRFRATAVSVTGHADPPAPVELRGAPDAALEWRLARVRGLVVDVRKLGQRWLAELQVGGARLLVSGLAGSGIAAGRLPEGATATVVGIVRRPYPTATDRRFAVVPRSDADIATTAGSGSRGGGTGGSAATRAGGAGPGARGATDPGTRTGEDSDRPPTIDLGQLGEYHGRLVRVGGLVVETGSEGVLLDDGTARAWLTLVSAALDLLPDLAVGDAVAATGIVAGEAGAERVVVDDPATVVLAAGLLSAPRPAASPPADGSRALGPEGVPPAGDVAAAAPGLAPPAFFGVMALIGLLLVELARRGRGWLDRRRVARRITARLASLAEPLPAPAGPPSVVAAVARVPDAGVTLPAGRSGPS